MVDDPVASGTAIPASSGAAPLRPLPASRVAFVGLGLVGGSLARATRRAWPAVRIVGLDKPAIVEAALELGAIDAGGPPEDAEQLLVGSDLVVLALPVLSIVGVLERLGPLFARCGAVITDTGSTKVHVAEAAARAGLPRFVGGHPMAGKSQGGLAHADPNLVVGAPWFLCPAHDGDPSALRLLRQWVRELGARPVELDAAEHDRAVALTSHVPHLVANALAEVVLEAGVLDAAGGSLRDVLRVAGAPFETWGDTLATNADAVRDALEELQGRIATIAAALAERDGGRERMRDLFARGRACKERLHG